MESLELTDAELRAEFLRLVGVDDIVDDPNARTMMEWHMILPFSEKQARKHIRQLVEQGKMERVKVRRYTERDQARIYDGYRFMGGTSEV